MLSTDIILKNPSITDWIQAFGVLIGAVGLVVNFFYQRKSTNTQIEATKAQLEMARRDYERFLFEIEPHFKFYSANIETDDAMIMIEVHNNVAIDMQIFNLSNDLIAVNDNLSNPHTRAVGSKIGIAYGIKHEIDYFDEFRGETYNFEIKYKDILNNQYLQKIRAYSDSEIVNYDHPIRSLS